MLILIARNRPFSTSSKTTILLESKTSFMFVHKQKIMNKVSSTVKSIVNTSSNSPSANYVYEKVTRISNRSSNKENKRSVKSKHFKTLIKKKMKTKYSNFKISYLNCWYTNATSLNNKMSYFHAEIMLCKPDVIFVAETWFTENSSVNLEGYNMYRHDRSNQRSGGGVSIYIKSSSNYLSFEILETDLDLKDNAAETVWCCLKTNLENIL